MKTICLHGALEKLNQGGKIEIDVQSPIEAIRFLSCVLPGFAKEIHTGNYYFARAKKEAPSLSNDALAMDFGTCKSLHILPDITGAKSGGAPSTSPESSPYESRDEENVSALFQGATNTTEQGLCVPVIYGRVTRAGSAVISAGISTEQVNYNDPGLGIPPFTIGFPIF